MSRCHNDKHLKGQFCNYFQVMVIYAVSQGSARFGAERGQVAFILNSKNEINSLTLISYIFYNLELPLNEPALDDESGFIVSCVVAGWTGVAGGVRRGFNDRRPCGQLIGSDWAKKTRNS